MYTTPGPTYVDRGSNRAGDPAPVTPDIRVQLDQLTLVIEWAEKSVERACVAMAPVIDDGPKQAGANNDAPSLPSARTALGREIQSKAERLAQISRRLDAMLSDLSL